MRYGLLKELILTLSSFMVCWLLCYRAIWTWIVPLNVCNSTSWLSSLITNESKVCSRAARGLNILIGVDRAVTPRRIRAIILIDLAVTSRRTCRGGRFIADIFRRRVYTRHYSKRSRNDSEEPLMGWRRLRGQDEEKWQRDSPRALTGGQQ